jgi:hypothetical protein
MATVPGTPPKKKTTNHADRLPRDGITGMGFSTQRHFIEVRKKMIDYVGQQEGIGYDEMNLPPHKHHHHHQVDPPFVDGKRASKPGSQFFTPPTSQKQIAHLGLATPKVDRRHGKSSSKPHAK